MFRVKHYPVNSSAISTVGYNPSRNSMQVSFYSGNVYRYSDVPKQKFLRFLNASSQGTFLNREIKPKHKVRRIV